MIIDVHCHLDLCYNAESVVKRAKERKVGLILSAGVDPKTNRKVLELSNKFKEVEACLGIYPIDSLKMNDREIKGEIEFIRKNKERLTAVGEVGIDFKESKDEKEMKKQEEIFKKFIKLALELNKPLVVHSRKAELKCIEILEEMKAEKVVMHCFSGKFKLAERIAENGWFLSIPANVKYSEHFQKIAREINIKNLLCETDSPFLHPDKKGNNEPVNVVESYKKIAEVKGLDFKSVELKVENNYKNLFGNI